MACRASGGRIVNLLDSRIVGYDPEHSGYMISKLLLYHFTRMLALDMAPRFTVNAIAPGPVLRPSRGDGSRFKRQVRSLPLRRAGSPQDIARAVLFLVESPFVTGQTLFVDGGRHLQ
jgi:NAD(P)-dependent dehydrogenase (short-subunit alcohol dehydrogenase family)